MQLAQGKKTDVVIIGAGPGGAVAALALAKAGYRSTVLDKATFPRQKPCGDVVTSQTLRALERVGLDPANELELINGQATWGTTCIAPNGKAVDVNFKPLHQGTEIPSCYTLKRESFDNYLASKLDGHPLIDLHTGTSVTNVIKQDDGSWAIATDNVLALNARLLLVASGCNSPLAAQLLKQQNAELVDRLNDDRHYGVGVRGYFKDLGGWRQEGMPEFYIIHELMPGGMYLTPLANGLVNVNVVMRRDFVKKHKINLQERFWEVLANHPTLSKRFSKDNLIGGLQGSSLSFGTIKRPVSGNGFMLIGDAAGLIDLMSANGISNAVMSAELAASHASNILKHKLEPTAAVLRTYDQQLEKKLANELKLGRLVAPFLGNERYFGLIEGILNFVASRMSGGSVLNQLLYHPDVGKLLRTPSFYKQMVWG